MKLPFIEGFLQCNAQSLRSLGVHNVEVSDQRKLTPLTPLRVGDIIGLTITTVVGLSVLFWACSIEIQKLRQQIIH
jgi:hypothetical protein